jgi:hypothetical protein
MTEYIFTRYTDRVIGVRRKYQSLNCQGQQ